MTIDETAKKLWKDVFGNVEWAQDCFGSWMHRDAHSNVEVNLLKPGTYRYEDYSWNIDHIRPRSDYVNQDEADFFNNYEPMHRHNNLEKSDNFPIFVLKNKTYKVISVENGYGIIEFYSKERIDWKGKQRRSYI